MSLTVSLDGALVNVTKAIAEGMQGEFLGRTVHEWTCYFFAAGSIVGIITAVAAYIFGDYPLVAISVLLAVTNGLAAYYAHHFVVIHELDDESKDLSEKVKQIQDENVVINKTDNDLTKDIKEL